MGELSAPGSRLALEQTGAAMLESPILRSAIDAADPSALAAWRALRQAGVQLETLGQPDLSMADPEGWLARHGWRARMYDAGERFAFYGRPVPPLLDPMRAGAVQGWLASAERL